jgi:hypothetical protein
MGKPEAVETVSKRAFYYVVALITTLLAVAEIIVARPYTPFSFFPIYAGALLFVNFLFSYYATDRFFKMLRMSRSGNSVETWDRIPAKPERLIAANEIVEHVVGRADVIFTEMFCFLACLAGAFVIPFAPLGLITFIMGSGLVLLGGVGLQQSFAPDGCYMRADHRGVFGYPARFAIHRKLLPWSEIATCDIVTRHDTFGKPYMIVPVFKDEFGTKLMRLSLWSVPMESQERLAKYIKAKLPKPRPEFEELR